MIELLRPRDGLVPRKSGRTGAIPAQAPAGKRTQIFESVASKPISVPFPLPATEHRIGFLQTLELKERK
jgi:hypothetical protein